MSNFNELILSLSSNYKDLTEKKKAINDSLRRLANALESFEIETTPETSLIQTDENIKSEALVTSSPLIRKNVSEIIKFNVGGTLFSTLKSTITKKIQNKFDPKSYYEKNLLEEYLIKKSESIIDEENNALFIDRNPRYFNYVLDYLRKANDLIEYEQLESGLDKNILDDLLNEANFYKLYGLRDLIEYSNISFSKILTQNQTQDLIELCEFKNFKFNLIYRGSIDGFSGRSFHKKCDNFTKTLIVVKVKDNDNIFGGYTEKTWSGDNIFKIDPKSFIFSLVNNDEKPIKMSFIKNRSEFSIYCYPDYGPTFGSGYDFYISNDSNVNKTSSSNLGSSFFHPTYLNGTNEAKNFLAGSCLYTIEEIEVYNKI